MDIIHEEYMRMGAADGKQCPMERIRPAVRFREPQRKDVETVFMPVYQRQKTVPEPVFVRMPRSEGPQKIFSLGSRRPKRTQRREIPVRVILKKRPYIDIANASVQQKQYRTQTDAP